MFLRKYINVINLHHILEIETLDLKSAAATASKSSFSQLPSLTKMTFLSQLPHSVRIVAR